MYSHWLNEKFYTNEEKKLENMAKFKELCHTKDKYIELDISNFSNELIIWCAKDIFDFLVPSQNKQKTEGVLNKLNTFSLFWKKINTMGVELVDNKDLPTIYDKIVRFITHTLETYFNVVDERGEIHRFIEFSLNSAYCKKDFKLRLGQFTPLDSKRHPNHPCAKYYKDYDGTCLENLGEYSLNKSLEHSKKQQIDMRDLFFAFARGLGKKKDVKTYKIGLFNFYWIDFGLCHIGYDQETNSILIQHDKFKYEPDKKSFFGALTPPTQARKVKIHDIRQVKLSSSGCLYIGVKFSEVMSDLLITGQYVFRGRGKEQHFSHSILSNEFEEDLLKMACMIITTNEQMCPGFVRRRVKEKLSDVFHIDFTDFPIINEMKDGAYPHIVLHFDKIREHSIEATIKCVEFSYHVMGHGMDTFDNEYKAQFDVKNLIGMLWNNDENKGLDL